MEQQTVRQDEILDVLVKIGAGFWPSEKEIGNAATILGQYQAKIKALEEENDRVKAALNEFAKIGALGLHDPKTPMLDYGNIQLTYSDFIRAAKILYTNSEK